MKQLSYWFWSKTRFVRYSVPISLVVLVLSAIGLYLSFNAKDESAAVVCAVTALTSFIAFGIITVEHGGTVVVKR